MSKQDLKDWLIRQLKNQPILDRFQSIYVPRKELKEYREGICNKCGGRKKDPVKYFGQEFCRACVQEMDPHGIYENIQKKRGWKLDLRKLLRK